MQDSKLCIFFFFLNNGCHIPQVKIKKWFSVYSVLIWCFFSCKACILIIYISFLFVSLIFHDMHIKTNKGNKKPSTKLYEIRSRRLDTSFGWRLAYVKHFSPNLTYINYILQVISQLHRKQYYCILILFIYSEVKRS